MPAEKLLIVRNVHSATSGRPPMLRTGEGYVSYFENDLGEQWVFSMDWKSEVFFLAGGNIGWEERIIGEEGLKDLECDVPEQMWILACLYACGFVDVAESVVAVWQDFEERIRGYSSDAASSPGAEQEAD